MPSPETQIAIDKARRDALEQIATAFAAGLMTERELANRIAFASENKLNFALGPHTNNRRHP